MFLYWLNNNFQMILIYCVPALLFFFTCHQAACSFIQVHTPPFFTIDKHKLCCMQYCTGIILSYSLSIHFGSAASKYCPLLIKEGGISLLEKVLKLDSSQPETKDMAR